MPMVSKDWMVDQALLVYPAKKDWMVTEASLVTLELRVSTDAQERMAEEDSQVKGFRRIWPSDFGPLNSIITISIHSVLFDS